MTVRCLGPFEVLCEWDGASAPIAGTTTLWAARSTMGVTEEILRSWVLVILPFLCPLPDSSQCGPVCKATSGSKLAFSLWFIGSVRPAPVEIWNSTCSTEIPSLQLMSASCFRWCWWSLNKPEVFDFAFRVPVDLFKKLNLIFGLQPAAESWARGQLIFRWTHLKKFLSLCLFVEHPFSIKYKYLAC